MIYHLCNKLFFADFETSIDLSLFNIIKNDVNRKIEDFKQINNRVYAAGLTYGFDIEECEKNYVSFENLDEFMLYLFSKCDKDNGRKSKNYIYFHNLAYDFSYIYPWLLERDWITDITITGDFKKLYRVDMIVNEQFKVSFLDSVKIIPLPLSKFGNLPGAKYSKLELDSDYDMSIARDITHKADEKELKYLKHDVLTLADGVINYMNSNMLESGFHMTVGSFALKTFCKELIKLDLHNTHFKLNHLNFCSPFGLNFEKRVNWCPLHEIRNYKAILNEKFDYTFIKNKERYYKGGQTFNNHIYQNKILNNVLVFDVNSLYPFSLVASKTPIRQLKNNTYNCLPKGKELTIYDVISKIDKDYGSENVFYLMTFECEIELKNDLTFSPFSVGFFQEVIYIEEMIADNVRGIKKGKVIFGGSEYDIENLKLYYNVTNTKVCEYFVYDILQGEEKEQFNNIINTWFENKQKFKYTHPEEAAKYKLLLNSVTGKFGQKTYETEFRFCEELNDFKHFEKGYESTFDTRMMDLILSLISFSRLYMSTYITMFKNEFVYCDTDSIHLTNITYHEAAERIKLIDSKLLGYFDHEKTYDRAIYKKPKTYLSEVKGMYKATVAGCKVNDKLLNSYEFEEFLNEDVIIGDKVLKTSGKNGTILLNLPYYLRSDQTDNNTIVRLVNKKGIHYLNIKNWYLSLLYSYIIKKGPTCLKEFGDYSFKEVTKDYNITESEVIIKKHKNVVKDATNLVKIDKRGAV